MIVDGQFHRPVEEMDGVPAVDKDRILATIRQRVAENLRVAYEASKIKYDKHARDGIEYADGQTVWKKNTKLSSVINYYSSKLDDKSVKCKIVRRVGSNTYLLSDMDGNEIGVFSTKMFFASR